MFIRLRAFGAVCLLIVLTLLMTVSCSWGEERARDNLAPIPFGANFTPQWSPDGKFLVTYADLGLIVVDTDGRQRWRLGQSRRDGLHAPALSAAGRLAYAKIRLKNKLGIFIERWFATDYNPDRRSLEIADADANGNGSIASVDVKSLKHPFLCWPAWSPDGSQVACYSWAGISIFHHTGTPISSFVLDRPEGWNDYRGFAITHLDWSPDGQRIAMILRHGAGSDYVLITVKPDGSDRRTLVSAAGRESLSALEWSADGQKIFTIYRTSSSDPAELVSVHSNGSNLRSLVILDGAEYAGASNYFPIEEELRLSPDSKQLLLTSREIWTPEVEFDRAVTSLHTVNTDGTGMRLVSRQKDALYTSWSPDGSRIAVATPHSDTTILYTMDTDGGDIKVLLERDASGEIVSGYGKHTATGGDGESR